MVTGKKTISGWINGEANRTNTDPHLQLEKINTKLTCCFRNCTRIIKEKRQKTACIYTFVTTNNIITSKNGRESVILIKVNY